IGRWVKRLFREDPAPPLPTAEARDYTRAELAAYDGSDPRKPLLVGIRGRVYDVTRGRDFYGPGGPYGMFAGKDCTRALAKMAFDDELFTSDEAGLLPHEVDQLEEWIDTFEGKYGSIGNLRS
ncbi:MAG: cytochrome b5-like heme/steroid binding domain-containing protein, partial [Myxococcota bacterium]